jgi:signal transduction histidine kinase
MSPTVPAPPCSPSRRVSWRHRLFGSRSAADGQPFAWLRHLYWPLLAWGFTSLDPADWRVYLVVGLVLTLEWPFCIQLAQGVEVYWPVRWTSAAAAYLLGPAVIVVYSVASTLGFVLIGMLDRAGIVRATGLAAESLQRYRGEDAPPENYVDGMLRQFLVVSSNALRATVAVVFGPAPPLPVLLFGEAATVVWQRLVPIPGRMAPRRERARIADALGRDVLVATGLLDVMMIAFVYRSYRSTGLLGFVLASASTLVLHTLLKRLNDARVQSEQRRAELVGAREKLARRERLAAIGETASVVFHQIGRHHGAIGMFAHLLARSGDPRVREQAARILESVADANRVIDELRRFREDRTLSVYAHSLTGLVDECVALCTSRARAHRVELLAADGEDAVLSLDKHKLRQAIVNLLDNAIEASPPGARVETTIVPNGSAVDLCIRDYGGGIAASVRDQLFTPFRTTKAEGTGLGLALAKELVEAHGGTITWHPAQPGTTFVVSLPRHRAE